ncbi:maturation protein [ssRNA phage SRR7976310_12]|uniref:Maturation protein n=1 Tax=ssRNA phage SRR7976310_12 TaxID=2786674 RepID=A0A8S5L0J0_9VIRU|nr:maturation protein [ssRNA phage SRR7976310_12]DAD51153.1 TPA_asm: maturation protein [ssRNA phage SRR7976310_12]
MTTPAQNVNIASAGINTQQQTTSGGVTNPPVMLIRAQSRFVRIRAASVNNPIRIDKTRKPSNWVSKGGYFGQDLGDMRVIHPNGSYRTSSGVLIEPPTSLGSIPTIVSIADGNSYAIRDALGHYAEANMQLGVAMREARGTAELVGKYYQKASQTLGRLDSELRKGENSNFKRAMKDFASGWKSAPSRYLEYIFGLRPLADEINNSLEVLSDKKERGFAFKMKLRGKYKVSDGTKVPRNAMTFCTALVQTNVVQKHKASLIFVLPDWFWDELPPVTSFSEAWQSASLSFILDRMVPVTSWLRGFEGLQLRPFFTEGSSTCFMSRVGTEAFMNPSSGYSAHPSVLPCTWREYYMSRVAYESFPTEAVMRLPRLRNELKLAQMDQYAALAGQRMANLSRLLR